jgi:Na+-translocating ferredoxin:NAD+ oxidoreductase subunit B
VTIPPAPGIVDAIDAALPQTQCTRCGYPDCRAYAEAMASGSAAINRCPPGGAEGVMRLAALTGRPPLPLDPACGSEGPLRRALIDEAWCIGCTLCITACPVDCIVGSNKRMHTVIAPQCTGCELCVPACPVDCISMVAVDAHPKAATGWSAWSEAQAADARQHYRATTARRARARAEHDERLAAKAAAQRADLPAASGLEAPTALERKHALIEAALARARVRRDRP